MANETLDLVGIGRQVLYLVAILFGVALFFGMGQYQLNALDQNSNGSLKEAVNMFSGQSGNINIVLTFLFIGAVAIVGIAIVKRLTQAI